MLVQGSDSRTAGIKCLNFGQRGSIPPDPATRQANLLSFWRVAWLWQGCRFETGEWWRRELKLHSGASVTEVHHMIANANVRLNSSGHHLRGHGKHLLSEGKVTKQCGQSRSSTLRGSRPAY